MNAGDGSGVLPEMVMSRLYAAVVSDILDDLGHRDHVLDPAIRPLGHGEVIAGPANPFLVTEVHQIPAEPYTGEIGALDDIRPGEVILVAAPGRADLTLTLTKPQLLGILAGSSPEGVQTEGDPGALHRLLSLLDTPDPGFAIVTP